MATLLQFRRLDDEAPRSPAKNRPHRRRSAEITIFPGVRIERRGQDADNGPAIMQKEGAIPNSERG
jgi:hypothetical protein